MRKILRWTPQEDEFVLSKVREFGVSRGLTVAAYRLKKRTLGAVQFHYYNVLSPIKTRKSSNKRTITLWKANELKTLNKFVKQYGEAEGFKKASKEIKRTVKACRSKYKKQSNKNKIVTKNIRNITTYDPIESKKVNNSPKVQCYSNNKLKNAKIILQKDNLIVATHNNTILTIEI